MLAAVMPRDRGSLTAVSPEQIHVDKEGASGDVTVSPGPGAGKRLLTRRIPAPAIDACDIDARYSRTGELGTLPDAVLQDLGRLLRWVVDI